MALETLTVMVVPISSPVEVAIHSRSFLCEIQRDSVSRARTSAFAAAGVDAEADGYFDLFGLASNQSTMAVYRARSTGLDTTARDITLDRSRVWLYAPYAGDFNGDGYGDVAAVTFSSPGLILVSHGGPGGFGSTPTQSITLPFSGTASFF